MKNYILIISIFLMTSCGISPQMGLANEMPKDFSFEFTYGLGGNTIDSKDETYSKAMGASEDHIIIDFVFSEEEKEEIYQKMKEIGIQNYPDNISEGEEVFGIPQQEYLRVTCDGKEYNTCYAGFTHALERNKMHEDFEELSSLIVSIIGKNEKVKSLPESKGGYE